MRKLILCPLAVAALTLTPAATAAADEGSCGTSAVTTTYHQVHLVPEPVFEAAGQGQTYEDVAHHAVECGENPTGLGVAPIFG